MANLYLCYSKNEKVGDVIIDLDKIFTIRLAERENEYGINIDYTNNDKVTVVFDSEQEMRDELVKILDQIKPDEKNKEFAQKIKTRKFNVKNKIEALKQILDVE